jgi:nucleoside-diphosphate-sugar epimerase
MVPQRIVYISTSGVYGNCDGALVPETRPLNPQTARAVRRVDAEAQLRRWGKSHKVSVCILRAPGIYAIDRLPIERLEKAMPTLTPEEDSYTNHIHADDLARITLIGLTRAKRGRIYNAVDNCPMKMGDYFDLVADHYKLARPTRIPRAEALATLPATSLSFMSESRRLSNTRLREELRIKLHYGSVNDALGSR